MTEEERPVCPYCGEVMVRGRIEMADGAWQVCWLCGCVEEDEDVREGD